MTPKGCTLRSVRRAAAVVGGVLVLTAATPASAALNCTVSTVAVTFGAYKSTDASAKTGRGEVKVLCTCTNLDCIGFSYTVDVKAGGSGSTAGRKMTRTGGTETLNYQLYSDALMNLPWTAPQGQLYLLGLMGIGQTVYVYGKLPAAQAVRVGDYTDSPGVTIVY